MSASFVRMVRRRSAVVSFVAVALFLLGGDLLTEPARTSCKRRIDPIMAAPCRATLSARGHSTPDGVRGLRCAAGDKDRL